jgi:hypothetical protein
MMCRLRLALQLLLAACGGMVRGTEGQQSLQPGFGAANRVVVVGIDGCRSDLVDLSRAPTLHRLLSGGASTLSARANLPTLSLPNWGAILTGSGPSETTISWNGWRRSTARALPVTLPLDASPPQPPPISAAWVPNMLEIAEAAGVEVSMHHDWAPLNRLLSPGFVERSVSWGNCTWLGSEWEELDGGPCGTHVAGDADSVAAAHAACLACWESEDAVAAEGAARAITRHGEQQETGGEQPQQQQQQQLVFLYQGVVDETGHAYGWGGDRQLESLRAVSLPQHIHGPTS